MDDDLPREFDLIVVGTGFIESSVAAAASRIGKTVLHVDPNEFYGNCWASFSLEHLQTFLANKNSIDTSNIANATQSWQLPLESNENDLSQTTVLRESRKFNIDLVPKVLFSAGKLVDLLVTSNICRYAEFRAIDHVCTLYNGDLLSVPGSRTDVFNTTDLTIIEKRLLMKLLTNCMNYDEQSEKFAEHKDKTFLECLQANKLTDKIIHCVINSIAMCDGRTSLIEGIEKTKMYLQSLGRYGNSPFLFPMHGCGEVPQCFCRLCAVFGGIYCLKRKIDITAVSAEGVTVSVDGTAIAAKHVVLSSGNIPDGIIPKNYASRKDQRCGNLARCIFITSTPIGNVELNSGGGGVNVMRLMDTVGNRDAILLQMSYYSGTCPKGYYLIHITTEAVSQNPQIDLQVFVEQIFNSTKEGCPTVLYSAYFLIPPCRVCKINEDPSISPSDKIFSTCGPSYEIDYDNSIENSKDIFHSIYPNEPFLPRAPDAEEIVIGDEDAMILPDQNVINDMEDEISKIGDQVETMDITDITADIDMSDF